MEVKEWPIKKVHPYEMNAKIHTDEQVEQIANSIRQFGWKQPLVVDKDGTIIVGHGRYAAANLLKLKKVPVVVASDLTEDETKAYRIADNKANESEWDFKKLREELENIEIDMDDFGVDFDFEEMDERHRENQVYTQTRVANILNLEKGDYTGQSEEEGYYQIPVLEPVTELPKIKEWIGFNEVLSDKNPRGKGVHFFIDDYQFERIWNRPEDYVARLKEYACVCTPDFSPYGNMPIALQIYNHYRKHWVGRYLQERGVTVIPTIRCSTNPESLKWYLDGEPRGGIVIISSMWTGAGDQNGMAVTEYRTMRDTLKPVKILIYGGKTENMGIEDDDPIEIVQNFTQRRYGND